MLRLNFHRGYDQFCARYPTPLAASTARLDVIGVFETGKARPAGVGNSASAIFYPHALAIAVLKALLPPREAATTPLAIAPLWFLKKLLTLAASIACTLK